MNPSINPAKIPPKWGCLQKQDIINNKEQEYIKINLLRTVFFIFSFASLRVVF
jgi:hypothetical protein